MSQLKCPSGSLEDPCSVLAKFIRGNAHAISNQATAIPCTDAVSADNAFRSQFQPELVALLEAISGYVHGEARGSMQCAGEVASLGIQAERCAVSHLNGGYSEVQLVLTFQGLRNIVLKLWTESLGESNLSILVAATRLQEAFDKALSAAVEHYCHLKDRCHGLFLQTLAHDFRNHLGGLDLAAWIMQQNTNLAAGGLHKIASSMARSVDNVMRAACDIHDIGTLRQGLGISVNPVVLDSSTLCRGLVDEFVSRNPEQAIVLEAAAPLMGRFDESRITQAFANLIGYASRHSAKGKVVTVRLQSEAGSLVFSVQYLSDCPLPEDFAAMFDPMRLYAKHLLSKKGPLSELGIHLYIAREIIVAHEGKLTAFADQGEITFEARLWQAAHASA